MLAVIAAIAAVVVAVTAGTPHDYAVPACTARPLCDDASRPIDALAGAHLGEFFRQQRTMGPVSEIVRAPFVAIRGGSQLDRYRAGLIPCLLALALFGGVLAWLAAERGRPLWFQALVGIGLLLNPIALAAVDLGHPEELLTAVLLVGSVLLALRGQTGRAGLAGGLAVATKLWALAGLPAALAAVAGPRWSRFALVAFVTAAIFIAATAVGSPSRFHTNVEALGKIGWAPGTVTAANVWWPLAHPAKFQVNFQAEGQALIWKARGYSQKRWLGRLAHPAILLLGFVIALAWLRLGRPGGPEVALLVLALALMLRCVLDPGTFSYYHAPFIIALGAYEALRRRWLPWLSLVAIGGYELLTHRFSPAHGQETFHNAYLIWALSLTAVMVAELTWNSLRARGPRARSHLQA